MSSRKLAAFGTAVVALTIGVAPILSNAADHLDAPALGGATANGQIAPHSEHGDRDINDVYVFRAPDNSRRTVIAMTVNPAINLFGGNFGTNVRYIFNIDKNGDEKADLAYIARFGRVDRDDDDKYPEQDYRITRYTGKNARSFEDGRTVAWGESNEGSARTRDSLKAWAGVRSDPFFFDLTGFIGTTTKLTTGTAVGGDALGSNPTDFFANLNTNAIVLSIPNSQLPDTIGVWATTQYRSDGRWKAADQMGRPAINTVFNPAADKNLFNRTPPSRQATAYDGKFRKNVINGLKFFSSLDSEGAYSNAQAAALADVLIPDVLVYSRSSTLPAPLNGRALADDVIDVELNVTTGGDPLGLFADRDATGAVPGDGVGPHTDYLSRFPYLGKPH
ncbi:MAG TPA: DUF4331 family protein [Candidatus Limnocylindrales bacterium]|nr:DUF4331 family protein [Candidatus Limnocylindrales bacterium]